METRKTMTMTRNVAKRSKRKAALKSISLFTVLALTPIALLFAGTTPLNEIEREPTQLERSQKEWKAMKGDVQQIMKKANRLKTYTAMK